VLTHSAGPTLGFVALALTDRVNVQVLEHPIRLDYHHTDAKLRATTARYLGAMKNALAKLKRYYQPCHSPTQRDVRLPCYLRYTCLADSTEHHLKYISHLMDDKLLFFGQVDEKDVCVKFVTRYSKDAHLHCASRGIAPRLRGFETLPGGWYMVVMDYIGDLFMPSNDAQLGLATGLRDLILEEMKLLHQAGYVHGDLRDMNLMVRRDGQLGFMMVDFDWAGKIGETYYPMNVNTGPSLWRPAGAHDGEIIKADHDIDMIEHLLHCLGI
jgi:hypothetical protein